MTITGITTNQTASLSLITGTTYDSNSSVSDVAAQGQGTDEATISKGAQQMSQLHKLATSDPAKFKEAAQEISDQLTAKAKESSDSNESSMLSDMAAKFAQAAKSGDMSSLKPQAPPTSADPASGSAQKLGSVLKFKNHQDNGGPMATLDSVVSGVLSDLGSSSSSSTSSVSASSETAA